MDNNLQKYQAFITTVECGSFTKAAEILGYAQSSISKMIADLEEEWKRYAAFQSPYTVRSDLP